jgi:hypothetical protein
VLSTVFGVIIWSRWGILVLAMLGLGAGTGSLLSLATGGSTEGPASGLFIGVGLVLAGVYTYLLNHFVIARYLDKPQQQFLLQRLPQPVVHPNGVRQTHERIAVLHPQTGQPVFVRPRSSLFFIPVHVWPYVFATIGIVLTIGFAIGSLAG